MVKLDNEGSNKPRWKIIQEKYKSVSGEKQSNKVNEQSENKNKLQIQGKHKEIAPWKLKLQKEQERTKRKQEQQAKRKEEQAKRKEEEAKRKEERAKRKQEQQAMRKEEQEQKAKRKEQENLPVNEAKKCITITKTNKERIFKSNIKIGIVITTHGFNGIYARQCLECFMREIPPNYFIVLYINESSDPITLELQHTHSRHNVHIVYVENQEEGGGLTGTWNNGVKLCLQNECDVVIISNDDVVFDGCINNIIWQCYLEKDALKYFGPISNKPGPKDSKINQCQYGMYPQLCDSRIAVCDDNYCYLNGFFMVFSREVLLLNMFDETYFFDPSNPFNYNEVEWFERFKQKGGIGVIVPQTFIYHYKLSTWRNNEQNDVCIYTVNTGLYDGMNLYLQKQPIDTLYYTDSFFLMYKCIQKGLIPFYVDTQIKESKLAQRLIKTNPSAYVPHHYAMSIYVDANITLKHPINISYQRMMNLVNELKNDNDSALYCFRHPTRRSVFEEARLCLKIKLISNENLNKMYNLYHVDNFKDDVGLTETNCLIRKHAPLVRFHEDWNKCITICRRDQLSFDYLLFKHNISYNRRSNVTKKSFLDKKITHINKKARLHESYH